MVDQSSAEPSFWGSESKSLSDREQLQKPTPQCAPRRSSQPAKSESKGKSVEKVAEGGLSGSSGILPYIDQLERSFGQPLGGIRAYEGPSAAEASEQLGAKGYATQGQVVLGKNANLRTVAEETGHALQQQNSVSSWWSQSHGITDPRGPVEADAKLAAENVVAGRAASVRMSTGPSVIAREELKSELPKEDDSPQSKDPDAPPPETNEHDNKIVAPRETPPKTIKPEPQLLTDTQTPQLTDTQQPGDVDLKKDPVPDTDGIDTPSVINTPVPPKKTPPTTTKTKPGGLTDTKTPRLTDVHQPSDPGKKKTPGNQGPQPDVKTPGDVKKVGPGTDGYDYAFDWYNNRHDMPSGTNKTKPRPNADQLKHIEENDRRELTLLGKVLKGLASALLSPVLSAYKCFYVGDKDLPVVERLLGCVELGLDIAALASVVGGGAKAGVKAGTKAALRSSLRVQQRVRALKASKTFTKLKGRMGPKQPLAGKKPPVVPTTKTPPKTAENPQGVSPRSPIQHEKYKRRLAGTQEKPIVKDAKLQGKIEAMWRDNAELNNKSLSAAIRYERKTGKPVKGLYHSQKGEDMVRGLKKWLRDYPKAAPGDIQTAKTLIKDLKDALSIPAVPKVAP